ncbi:MAG: ATP synthase subunit I [Candidatus Sedimenticola sp. 20ELBAFRAG]
MQLANKTQAYRIILAQLATSFLTALALLAIGWVEAYSALAGGLTAVFANLVFALVVFGRYQAQEPTNLVARFYGAELLKLVVTGILFAVAILWVSPLSIGALLGAYLLVAVGAVVVFNLFN